MLDALYARHLSTGKRPSAVEAQLQYLPEWSRDRMFDALQALEAAGDILNPTGVTVYVDLSSTARARAVDRASPPASSSTTINIGSAHNSPIQHIAAGGHGVQDTHYQATRNDLKDIVEVYRRHVDDLSLDATTRRRADAQVATIEAQLQDEPDPTIVKAAGNRSRLLWRVLSAARLLTQRRALVSGRPCCRFSIRS
jgi:hypothetical protein